ncbi:hypothetical protein [Aquimarina rubra]|uniref:DoxX family protein n=1 Tax=Aquimarina rubra TaxID=1920033 RepID=A0ABW5LBZ3_9FLAO
MELLKEYLIPWSISNSISILFLVAAIRKPKLARLVFILLFAWACWINITTVHQDPNAYLEYAKMTPFQLYADFINGWFTSNSILMVTLIAIAQGLIAIGMMLKGQLFQIACLGAVIFFLAIIPLGIGSGFPATLIASIAIYFIWKKDDRDYLWRFKNEK